MGWNFLSEKKFSKKLPIGFPDLNRQKFEKNSKKNGKKVVKKVFFFSISGILGYYLFFFWTNFSKIVQKK